MQRKFVKNEIELERDIQNELADWKAKRHNVVLQVEGPRQVGKTHEVQKFAYNNYEHVIYVNLVRDEFGFEDMLGMRDFMNEYCMAAGLESYVDNEKTILIIDEIQESSIVYNAIRDLREQLRCDIVVSGSYLARTVNSKDYFLPAGIAYLRVFPLSFQEFCRALGLETTWVTLDPYGASDEEDYKKLKGVFVQMAEEKKGTGKTFIEMVTNFVKDAVKEPVSRNEVRMAASWLLYSGIIGYCDLYNNGEVTDVVSNRRAYFADCGIANYISTMVTVPKDALEGLFTENFVYTELNRHYQKPVSKRKVRGDKPCFSVCGDYELDFVVVGTDYVRTGIEVKTSDNRARSLEFFKEKGLIDRAVRVMPAIGEHGPKFDSVPIYLVGREF